MKVPIHAKRQKQFEHGKDRLAKLCVICETLAIFCARMIEYRGLDRGWYDAEEAHEELLQKHLKELNYSDKEIEAFVDDMKCRMWLKQRGYSAKKIRVLMEARQAKIGAP